MSTRRERDTRSSRRGRERERGVTGIRVSQREEGWLVAELAAVVYVTSVHCQGLF